MPSKSKPVALDVWLHQEQEKAWHKEREIREIAHQKRQAEREIAHQKRQAEREVARQQRQAERAAAAAERRATRHAMVRALEASLRQDKDPAGIAATKSGDRQVNSKVERGDMMSLVTQTSDLSPTHDTAAFAIFPPGSALRAVARERAHELLAGRTARRKRPRPSLVLAGWCHPEPFLSIRHDMMSGLELLAAAAPAGRPSSSTASR